MFSFSSKEIQIKVDVGAPCISKKVIFEETSAAYNVPCYISPSVHRGLETVHLVLAILILSWISVTLPHNNHSSSNGSHATSFYCFQVANV